MWLPRRGAERGALVKVWTEAKVWQINDEKRRKLKTYKGEGPK